MPESRLPSMSRGILILSICVLVVGFVFLEPRAPTTPAGATSDTEGTDRGAVLPPPGSSVFIQFYLGGLAVANGANPYAPLATLGPRGDEFHFRFSPFSHPPTTLLPYLPLSRVPLEVAIWINLLISVGTISVCMWLWGRLLSPDRRGPAMILSGLWVLFTPSLHLLLVGQNSFFVLASITAGAWALTREPGTRVDLLGGAGIALAIVKPHIAAVVIAGILGYSLGSRRFRLLLVAGAVCFAWIAVWTLLARDTWGQFFSFLEQTPTTTWYGATLDGRFREAFQGSFSQGLARPLAMAVWLFAVTFAAMRGRALGRAGETSVLETIALFGGLSLVACPHVFPYDFVLLLPMLAVCLVSWMRRQSALSTMVLVSWAGLSGAYLVVKTLYTEESIFWWLPWAALLLTAGSLAPSPQGESSAHRSETRSAESYP